MLQIYENRHHRAYLDYVSKGLTTINKLNLVLYAAARCYWYFQDSPDLTGSREIMENLFIFGFNARLAQDRIAEALNSNASFRDIIPCLNISTRCLRLVTNAINLHHRSDTQLNSLHLDLRLLHDSAKLSFTQLSFSRSEMLSSALMLEIVTNQVCGIVPMIVEETSSIISDEERNAIGINSRRVRQNMGSIYSRL